MPRRAFALRQRRFRDLDHAPRLRAALPRAEARGGDRRGRSPGCRPWPAEKWGLCGCPRPETAEQLDGARRLLVLVCHIDDVQLIVDLVAHESASARARSICSIPADRSPPGSRMIHRTIGQRRRGHISVVVIETESEVRVSHSRVQSQRPFKRLLDAATVASSGQPSAPQHPPLGPAPMAPPR